jgi:hypothetical protein
LYDIMIPMPTIAHLRNSSGMEVEELKSLRDYRFFFSFNFHLFGNQVEDECKNVAHHLDGPLRLLFSSLFLLFMTHGTCPKLRLSSTSADDMEM